MGVSAYLKGIDGITSSNLICRCCGYRLYVLSNASESICNFCEAYVRQDDANMLHSDPKLEKTVLGMQQAASEGRWAEGVAYADALAATKDPYVLFGASSFYRFFSDFTYNGVDYTLGGFMYDNAAKRSDQPINKNNAMELISKSKGCLFRAMKIIGSEGDAERSLLHIGFMSNMQLKRHAEASKYLPRLSDSTMPEAMKAYANMVFLVESRDRKSEKYISNSISLGIANSFYYAARMLALDRKLDDAIKVLDKFVKKTNMPTAYQFHRQLDGVKMASET